MTERRCDVAVIGAGTAGLKAYKAASARGADVVLIERGEGGSTCTRFGCMPSKLLIAAGRAAHDARGAGLFGIAAGPVRIDDAAVLGRMRAERDRFTASVLDDYHAIPADRRVQGSARFTGPGTLAVGDLTIRAGAVVVAVGARPIVPEPFQPAAAVTHTHETIFEIDALPRRLAVIGAGPLGIELAQAFARLGAEVTVLDDGETVAGMSDPEARAAAIAALGEEVRLALGVEAKAEMAGDAAIVRWTGNEPGEVKVDLILVAAGRPPVLDDLDLAAAGVPLDDDGVPRFEETTRTCGDSGVFVAGDAAGNWRPVLHEAARGGTIAGRVAAGGEAARPWPRFAVTFTELNLVEVGTRFPDLPEGSRIGCAKVTDNGRARADGHEAGLVRLYADADGKLLGASIVAPEGEHLGHLVALAIDRGMDAETFADQPWYHPTVEEMLQQAARDLAGIDA